MRHTTTLPQAAADLLRAKVEAVNAATRETELVFAAVCGTLGLSPDASFVELRGADLTVALPDAPPTKEVPDA